ncbi:hypothetical protein DFP72DRAFT_859360 [Ephemerocybe angulata]|uniref:Dolichyl-phosphate-mannose--protein mannosyltransferase n=1 Tax=Ephemerocybe angulata TaxID=980116 RepID=A0A8H6H9Y8_9AGAR|nr:hypothetical protein DFP72DRAFT_859360 [Tulosesus angulatus]
MILRTFEPLQRCWTDAPHTCGTEVDARTPVSSPRSAMLMETLFLVPIHLLPSQIFGGSGKAPEESSVTYEARWVVAALEEPLLQKTEDCRGGRKREGVPDIFVEHEEKEPSSFALAGAEILGECTLFATLKGGCRQGGVVMGVYSAPALSKAHRLAEYQGETCVEGGERIGGNEEMKEWAKSGMVMVGGRFTDEIPAQLFGTPEFHIKDKQWLGSVFGWALEAALILAPITRMGTISSVNLPPTIRLAGFLSGYDGNFKSRVPRYDALCRDTGHVGDVWSAYGAVGVVYVRRLGLPSSSVGVAHRLHSRCRLAMQLSFHSIVLYAPLLPRSSPFSVQYDSATSNSSVYTPYAALFAMLTVTEVFHRRLVGWLFFTGISIRCITSVKMIGLFVTVLVGVYTVEDLSDKMSSLFQATPGHDFYKNPLGTWAGEVDSFTPRPDIPSRLEPRSNLLHYKDNNEWNIFPAWNDEQYDPEGPLRYLKDDDTIRPSHLNYEVSGYGNLAVGDNCDCVEIADDTKRGTVGQWGFNQIEVNCDKENNKKDAHTYWNVESQWDDRLPARDMKQYKSPFLREFWHLNVAAMTSNETRSSTTSWRKYNDRDAHHFLYGGNIACFGWAFYYVPFLIMGRVTYLHHYLPTPYFAVLMFGHLLDDFKVSSRRFSTRPKDIVFGVLVSILVVTFWLFNVKKDVEYLQRLRGYTRGWLIHNVLASRIASTPFGAGLHDHIHGRKVNTKVYMGLGILEGAELSTTD